jgi:DNA-binding MarR family transcriptional regulator
MTANPKQIEAVTSAVRGLFHRLRAFGDRLHADLGITTAMRGVMESLSKNGPMTVPQMARQRPVSRQHIQMLVNQLSEAGLCASLPNPEHKRSVLIELTAKGHDAFEEIRRREAAAIAELFGDIASDDLDAGERALAAMTAALDRSLHLPQTEKDNDDDDD